MGEEGDLIQKTGESPQGPNGWPLLDERETRGIAPHDAPDYPLRIKLPLDVVRRMERVVKGVYRLLRWGEKRLKTKGETWRENEQAMQVLRNQATPIAARALPARIDTETGKSLDITTPQSLRNALYLSSNVRGVELVENANGVSGATVRIVLELNTRGNTDPDNLRTLFNEGGNPFGSFVLSSVEFKGESSGHRTNGLFTLSALLPPPTQEDLDNVEIDKPKNEPDQGETLPIVEFEFTPRFRERLLNLRYLTEEDVARLMENQSSANQVLRTFDAWESMRIVMPRDMFAGAVSNLAWKGSAALQDLVQNFPGRMHKALLPILAQRYYNVFYDRYFRLPAQQYRDALFPIYEKILEAIDGFTTDPQADILDLQQAILKNAITLSMMLKEGQGQQGHGRLKALISSRMEREGQAARAVAEEILKAYLGSKIASPITSDESKKGLPSSQSMVVNLDHDPAESGATGRQLMDQFNSLPDRPIGVTLKQVQGLPAKKVTCVFRIEPVKE